MIIVLVPIYDVLYAGHVMCVTLFSFRVHFHKQYFTLFQ